MEVLAFIAVTLFVAGASAWLGCYFGVIAPTAIFATLIVIANITAGKVINFLGFYGPAGVIIFAASFLVTDIITEVWGKEAARRAVWIGFYANLVLVLYITIVIHWTPAPFAVEYAKKFAEVLGLVPRIVLASMVAYLLSQHHDVWAFHFWREKTAGRFLWLRNNASTLVSQALDTTVFITIAFYGVFPILPMIFGQYLIKVLIAIIDTPFCYLFCHLARGATHKVKSQP